MSCSSNTHRTIRLAIFDDIPAIMLVIDAARELMHASGNVNQWINGYPSEEVIHADIDRDGGFVVTDDERIVAYFAFLPAPEPTYTQIYEGVWRVGRTSMEYGIACSHGLLSGQPRFV